MASGLSDKALAVFAFAAYHQLESGEPVSRVVARDGAGHRADPQAVEELTSRGLATVEGDRIVFSDKAEQMLTQVIEAMRRTANAG